MDKTDLLDYIDIAIRYANQAKQHVIAGTSNYTQAIRALEDASLYLDYAITELCEEQ